MTKIGGVPVSDPCPCPGLGPGPVPDPDLGSGLSLGSGLGLGPGLDPGVGSGPGPSPGPGPGGGGGGRGPRRRGGGGIRGINGGGTVRAGPWASPRVPPQSLDCTYGCPDLGSSPLRSPLPPYARCLFSTSWSLV